MDKLNVHLFKHSFKPFISLLNEHKLKYQMVGMLRAGVVMNSSETLEILKVISSATFWPSLATVIVAFINRSKNRKVIVTTNDETVIHLEGMSSSEIETILQQAKSITAIATTSEGSD